MSNKTAICCECVSLHTHTHTHTHTHIYIYIYKQLLISTWIDNLLLITWFRELKTGTLCKKKQILLQSTRLYAFNHVL